MDTQKRYQMKTQRIDYQNAKIYKIVNDFNDTIFIGCTTSSLNKKWAVEKMTINRTFQNHPFIKKLIKTHYHIILIENYPCKYKEQLNARTSYYVKKLKPEKKILDNIISDGITNTKKNTE
jgi:hypothetical protein